MLRLPLASLMLAFSLLSFQAFACDTIESARLDSECVAMPYGQQPGVWFRLDRAEALRQAALSFKPLTDRAEAAEGGLTVRAAQVVDLTKAVALLQEAGQAKDVQLDFWKGTAAAATAAEAKARKDAERRWYERPALWSSLGATAGGFAGCVLAKGDPRWCGLGAGGGGAILITLSLVL